MYVVAKPFKQLRYMYFKLKYYAIYNLHGFVEKLMNNCLSYNIITFIITTHKYVCCYNDTPQNAYDFVMYSIYAV